MNKNLKKSDTKTSLKTLINPSESLTSLKTLVKPSESMTTLYKPNSKRGSRSAPSSARSSAPSSPSSPISYTEKDEQALYRKQYLERKEKEKSLLGAVKKMISYIETKGVQVGKPYKKAKAKKEKKSKK